MFLDITNKMFLEALFGDDAPWVHVTDFAYDPADIPKERHLAAWAGDYASRRAMQQGTNQYFTISCFYADEEGKARRRKALFRHTPVIVLDDVKEKLSMSEVSKLPQPSWILETSPGSEQWGYILQTPCDDRGRVENLLDGLVANGLAPDGKDPGMKGVTRYVRLPEGYNTKASKMVNGQPFKCQMISWRPERRTTLEALAAPFAVNLDALRREQRVDGASDIPDHPLLHVTDLIHVKEVRSDGRFDITCPWVDEHTGADDSGAAVFTNDDLSIGFKCHHGACQHRTGKHLLDFIEQSKPGFGAEFAGWKAMKSFEQLTGAPGFSVAEATPAPVSFLDPEPAAPVKQAPEVSFLEPVSDVSFLEEPAPQPPAPPQKPDAAPTQPLQQMVDALKRQHPTSPETTEMAQAILKAVDEMPEIQKIKWHDQVRDTMMWSKQDLSRIVKDLKSTWYAGKTSTHEFYDKVIFVADQNQFYDWRNRRFYSVDAFQNANAHLDAEARKTALQDGRVQKVDTLDFAPGKARVFEEMGSIIGNIWCDEDMPVGVPGDVSPWLNHWDTLGWSEHRKHMLQFMAYTIKHPERKINHMLILGSREGCGKDWLLYPLIQAMGNASTTIDGDALAEQYNGYLMGTKHLHVNETELADHREAKAVSARLKPIAAAPPVTTRIREMYTKPIYVQNLVNGTMTTNDQTPIRLNGPSRRFFCVWSDLITRANNQMLPEWVNFWEQNWNWMINGGALHCIHYLRNCVDLSDFNPGAAPVVTEFLQDIQEASKSPAEQTVQEFIEHEIGMFKCDLLTPKDAATVLRYGDIAAPNLMHLDAKKWNVNLAGRVLDGMDSVIKKTAQHRSQKIRLRVIRNREKYMTMTPSELFHEYNRQIGEAREKQQLTVVGKEA